MTQSVPHSTQSASERNVDVVLVTDSERGTGKRIHDQWPEKIKKPTVYEDVKGPESEVYAKMHSKLILVDNKKMLLTSANFTFHGMIGNIEFGVLLEGEYIKKIREVLKSALNSDTFIKKS